MTLPDDEFRVRHLVEAAEKAIGYAAQRERVDLDTDELLRLALTKLVEIVGEAAKQVSAETRGKHPAVPWSAAARMRDRLIHHYFDINLDVLWATVTEDLRDLLDALARSQAEMGPAEPGRYPRSDRRRLRPPPLHGVVDPVMTSLELERDRVLMSLSKDGAVLSADQLLGEPGLYALWPASGETLKQLGLKDASGETPLVHRPMYIGKAEDSLAARVARKHLVSGDTGHSTVRRTLASLLDLQSVPRRSGIRTPTPKQLQTMTTNFDLSPQDDDTLTRWMAEHIVLRATPSHWRPLRDLELAVGAVLRPPLDQDRPPMWSPNPWRDQVATARRRLGDRAKAHVR